MPRCAQCGNDNAFITPHDSEQLYCSACYHANIDDDMELAYEALVNGHGFECATQFHKTYKCICKKGLTNEDGL